MADLSKSQLKKEITDLLQNADLQSVSAKKVRQQLEEKMDCDLSDRKKEIDQLIMECVDDRKGSDDEEEEEEEEERKPVRSKRGKGSSDESDQESDSKDDDYSPSAKKAKAAPKHNKKANSDSDSDADWKKSRNKKNGAAAAPKPKGGKRETGFTKTIGLSPALAEIMGEDAMPRHQVVKKMWAIIKERNLYDPKNKQYAICDEQLLKVFGVKRFRTFGMMKYLKDHFH